MKILLLTCNTGQGHNSSAQALQQTMLARGHICDIGDTLEFLSKNASQFIDSFHTSMYRYIPKAFNLGYSRTDARLGGFTAADSVTRMLSLGVKKLYQHIINQGYTHVLCVHIFSAIMVTILKQKYALPLRTGFLSTDYTCYPFMEKTLVDQYFLPHADLAEEFVQAGIPADHLCPTGIPVRRDFVAPIDRTASRRALNLPTESKVVFLMGGSMGCGPIEELALSIARAIPPDAKLLVSCGTNEKLLRLLQKQSAYNVLPFRYSDNIPQIMAASDLFVTKPGGISITEAGTAGLPMLLLDVVGGCETPNYRFFTDHGYAFGAESIENTAALCRSLLASPDVLAEQSQRLRQNFGRDAAVLICDTFLQEYKGR